MQLQSLTDEFAELYATGTVSIRIERRRVSTEAHQSKIEAASVYS
jgi:hypothetical protein